jgi:hypothetical protein
MRNRRSLIVVCMLMAMLAGRFWSVMEIAERVIAVVVVVVRQLAVKLY